MTTVKTVRLTLTDSNIEEVHPDEIADGESAATVPASRPHEQDPSSSSMVHSVIRSNSDWDFRSFVRSLRTLRAKCAVARAYMTKHDSRKNLRAISLNPFWLGRHSIRVDSIVVSHTKA